MLASLVPANACVSVRPCGVETERRHFLFQREGTSEMAIHRTTKTTTSGRNWKCIDGETLQDRLSLDAYAILIYILGKSDDWEVYSGEVAAHFRVSLDRVRKGLNELISKGYMTRVPRYENGKLKGWIYQVYETPGLPKTATLETDHTASSHPENDQLPNMDKRPNKDKRPNMKKSSYSATTSPSASEFQSNGEETSSPSQPNLDEPIQPEHTFSPANLTEGGGVRVDMVGKFLENYCPFYEEIIGETPPEVSEHHKDILTWDKDRRERLQALTADPGLLRRMLMFCCQDVPLEGHKRWGKGGNKSPYILTDNDCWQRFMIYEVAREAVREGKEPKNKDELKVYWYLNEIKKNWKRRAFDLDLYTEDDIERLAKEEAAEKRQSEERERRDAEYLAQRRQKEEAEKERERKAQEESKAWQKYLDDLPSDLIKVISDPSGITEDIKAAFRSRASVEVLRAFDSVTQITCRGSSVNSDGRRSADDYVQGRVSPPRMSVDFHESRAVHP